MMYELSHSIDVRSTVTIYITDASKAGWQRVANLISDVERAELAGHTGNAEVALKELRELKPDILILDIDLPPREGISLLRTIVRELPVTTVIAMSESSETYYRRTCLGAGARYFIDKSTEIHTLPRIIREIMGDPHHQHNHQSPSTHS